MTQLRREPLPSVPAQGAANRSHGASRLPLVFGGLLLVGVVGVLAYDTRWVEAVANHLWGLGTLGLLGCLAARIAKKKGRDYRRAFLLGSLLPIVLGTLAALGVYLATRFVYCGGGVALLSAVVVILGYACLRIER